MHFNFDGYVESLNLALSRIGHKVNLLILCCFFLVRLAALCENTIFTNWSNIYSIVFLFAKGKNCISLCTSHKQFAD